jgi:2-polyprenyl-3-methyl-5-hydroxy-6-metoxy-1,4-benzoquinol methylase
MMTVDLQTPVDELANRLLSAALGAVDLMAIYVGDRLGWYRLLAEDGPMTPEELAQRTHTHPRYAREWLEQQAVTGLLTVEDADDQAWRRFSLPPAATEVLTNGDSLAYLAPLSRLFAASSVQLPHILEAYRTGGGVSWAEFGADAREAQADMNRPWYLHALPGALAEVPSLDGVLRRPGARIADVGCGGGWSSIALAQAYPDARVEGYDIDPASVDLARTNVATAELSDRVSFRLGDAAEMPQGVYDAVFAFECIHDMPRPVDVLAAAARSLNPEGSVVVMDEAVAESFTAPGDELNRLMYGFSLFMCLPDGMAHPPTAATGTVMRPDTLRAYAEQAGLNTFEVLPIEDFGFWRFYRLTR